MEMESTSLVNWKVATLVNVGSRARISKNDLIESCLKSYCDIQLCVPLQHSVCLWIWFSLVGWKCRVENVVDESGCPTWSYSMLHRPSEGAGVRKSGRMKMERSTQYTDDIRIFQKETNEFSTCWWQKFKTTLGIIDGKAALRFLVKTFPSPITCVELIETHYSNSLVTFVF